MKQGGKKVRALGIDDEAETDELPQLTLAQHRKDDVFAMDNVFYSTYRPDDLMKLFEEACKDKDFQYERNNAKGKLVLTCLKEQSDSDKEIGLPQEGFQAKVKFSEVDKNRVAIEFSKMAGSSDFYRDQFTWMKAVISDYINVASEE